MAITLYDYALSPVIHGLRNALVILRKAQAHAEANSVDLADYTTARLYPDMGDFCYQVYRFTDAAKSIPSRLNPSNPALTLPDDEKTFPELIERINKTLAYIESITPESLAGRDLDVVVMRVMNEQVEIRFDNAAQYLGQNAHLNFWFHVTTMYGLLRMKGVPVGKMDIMNGSHTIQFKLGDGEYSTDTSKLPF